MRLYFFTLLFCLSTLASFAQETSKVMVMDIKADIDPRVTRYVELALDHAEEIEADYVIIEMDTYGGIVTDANDIRTMILEYKKPIFVFINKDAASAGALISIACDSIYMSPGANIGAATVVMGETGEAAPDKYQSYMRSIMRSTAQETGRDPKIAEAMVDQNIEIEGVTEKGSVITFSTKEAIEHNFCEGEVESVEEILALNKIEDYEIIRYEISVSESIIAFFINPFISGILIMVIVGGIYFELQTPGVGFPILAASIAIVLYLVPYYLNGIAENWEIALFLLGIILLFVEAFVIPGFGIAGVSGLALTIGSLSLIMLNNDAFDFSFVDGDKIVQALLASIGGIVGGTVLLLIGGVGFANSNLFKRVALTTTLDSKEGYTSNFKSESFMGREATAYTILRPSGRIEIDGELFDAYTRGEYIDQGAKVIVIDEEGTSLKVKLANG